MFVDESILSIANYSINTSNGYQVVLLLVVQAGQYLVDYHDVCMILLKLHCQGFY